jgi:putative SOS response-associated peptidase YedK
MCGRFVQARSVAELAELFEAEPVAGELSPARYNLAPTQPAAVVVERPDGRRGVTTFEWGLIPGWARSARAAGRPINARAETLASSPLFRDSFRRHRCLVPADAFFEWAGTAGTRQPWLIRRRDRAPLALAGVWAAWHEPEGDRTRRTFAIVTTAANDLLGPIHDRMPVILAPGAWNAWLSRSDEDPGALLGLLVPAPSDDLERFAVSRLVNDVRNDGPALLEPTEP